MPDTESLCSGQVTHLAVGSPNTAPRHPRFSQRRHRQVSVMLSICGAVPMILLAGTSQVRSACLLWGFGILPWLFAAMAACGFQNAKTGAGWNLLLGGVLLTDAWFGGWYCCSRDVYYTIMLHAVPFLNIALLVAGYGLLMLSPVLSAQRLRRRLPVTSDTSGSSGAKRPAATKLAPR